MPLPSNLISLLEISGDLKNKETTSVVIFQNANRHTNFASPLLTAGLAKSNLFSWS